MAKKRKSRASEAQPVQPQKQQAPEEIPPQEPEPGFEPEPMQSNNQEPEVPVGDEGDPEEEVEFVEEVEEVEEEEDEEEEENVGEQNQSGGGSAEIKQLNGGGAVGGEANNYDEYDEDEPFEKILEPFSKDQMVVLLKEAVTKYPEFMESVKKLADADPAHRKIFVHGLGWDTTAETLTSVFGKYGEIEDCKAVTDKVSGKSKGYGFILYKHRSGARKALKEPQKKIGNRMTSCQLASTGPVPAPPPTAAVPPASEYTQRKIFISNVSAEIDPHKLMEYFSKFGEIEEGPLGLDKHTGKPKGFCLFVYKSLESAKKALEEPHKNFEGHTLHCQKAIDGPKPTKGNYPQQQHYGGGQQHHQQQHQQQYYGHPAKKGKYSGGSGSGSAGSTGHLMAPAGPAVGFNPAVAAAPALTPALGQALTALLASQGAGLGIGNLLGGLGGPVTQGVPPVMNNAGYGGQGAGGYGQPAMQGGYQNPQMGSQGAVRPQQGGGYMGHGH
ncbi:hypothetical protein M9H77_13842 [Catharanthus roseus]|uniref:Uncharacterized protein n=1 Tax=Catharanthus roseus TaxID=4058 RepID=A0ACC0BLJ0_CATRO|nr:hypothetical protein M9H77_13842 [Catharanthus roseus]